MLWVIFLLSCKDRGNDTDTAPPASATLSWSAVAEDVPEGAFLSVWGPSADDVWVVGGQYDAGYVLRGSGSDWSPQPLPEGTPLLNWVHGTSSSDIWLAGLSGTLLHWDGSAWTDHSVETDAAFWGLYAHPSGEVLAVGGASRWGGEAAMIWRYDGSAWASVDLPEPFTELTNLFKVNHDGSQYWLVGAGGAALAGDGASFSAVATGYAGDLVTVTRGDGDDIVVVGGRGTGVVLSSSGDRLSVVSEANAGLNGAWIYPSGQAVVVGERGYSAVFSPSDESINETVGITLDILHATWGQAGGKMYAVGGNLNTAEEYFHGVVLVSDAPK